MWCDLTRKNYVPDVFKSEVQNGTAKPKSDICTRDPLLHFFMHVVVCNLSTLHPTYLPDILSHSHFFQDSFESHIGITSFRILNYHVTVLRHMLIET